MTEPQTATEREATKCWMVCQDGVCDVIHAHTAGKAKAAIIREAGDIWPFSWTKMRVYRKACWDRVDRNKIRELMVLFHGMPEAVTFK